MIRCIATNIDTLIIATAEGPTPPDDAKRAGRGLRWSPMRGVSLEANTANTLGVTDARGTPLPFRWTLGPDATWSHSLADLAGRLPWLSGGDVMGLHVCRDWHYDDDQAVGEDPLGWVPPTLARGCRQNPRAASVVAAISRQADAWYRDARGVRHGVYREPDNASTWKGSREAIQVQVYCKTASDARCEGHVPTYAHAWAAGGWPTRTDCSVCGAMGPAGKPCPCGDARFSYQTVMRCEVRWPRKYLHGRTWRDLPHALAWPLAVRTVAGVGDPRRGGLLLPWGAASAPFEPPRQRRARRTLETLTQHHADMEGHHARRKLELALQAGPDGCPYLADGETLDIVAALHLLLDRARHADAHAATLAAAMHELEVAAQAGRRDAPIRERASWLAGHRAAERAILAALRRLAR